MKKTIFMLLQTLKVFILFTGCTILFYFAILWFNEEYQDYHRYDEPSGTAVKVMADGETESTSWRERLLLFYLNGE